MLRSQDPLTLKASAAALRQCTHATLVITTDSIHGGESRLCTPGTELLGWLELGSGCAGKVSALAVYFVTGDILAHTQKHYLIATNASTPPARVSLAPRRLDHLPYSPAHMAVAVPCMVKTTALWCALLLNTGRTKTLGKLSFLCSQSPKPCNPQLITCWCRRLYEAGDPGALSAAAWQQDHRPASAASEMWSVPESRSHAYNVGGDAGLSRWQQQLAQLQHSSSMEQRAQSQQVPFSLKMYTYVNNTGSSEQQCHSRHLSKPAHHSPNWSKS